MTPITVDTAVLFYPRGGSAQVIRYLLTELNARGYATRLHAGSLGPPATPSHAPTFYDRLDLRPYDYNPAQTAFEHGKNPQGVGLPFHPSYEDRGHCPDPLFSAVPPASAVNLTHAWHRHLTANRSPQAQLLHLHHLSHLQEAARRAYPAVPVITTLHGTELKFIAGMTQRQHLAVRVGESLPVLARDLHSHHPQRETTAHRIAARAKLDDATTQLLLSTAWEKWTHSTHWLTALRSAAGQAGQIVTVSRHDHDLAQHLLPLTGHHLPVITNGVDTHRFCPNQLSDTQRTAHLRHWLVTDPHGWAPDDVAGSIRYTDADLTRLHDSKGRRRPVLLWVGRFLTFKRIDVLLHAFADVRRRLDPAPILLMWGGYPGECEGQHPARTAAELRIENDVFFVGWRGHDELPAGLNCADLMVAPAVNEPLGMVYLEAMACGTPPISTSTGGPRETIIPNGPAATGWHTAPDDSQDLASVLVAALTDTAERKRRSDNAVRHVRRSYDWSYATDQYANLYDQAIRSAGRSTCVTRTST